MDEELKPTNEITIQPDEEPNRTVQPVDDEQPPRLAFPVVGIGASAGGLEAVSAFLDAMPPDSGMAFVLIQHLPPDRESMMAEILTRRTAMTVVQVEDGMLVEPNHVYVIRPGHILTIHEGRLHLGLPLGSTRAANRPVDDFFKSLAEEQRERGIAVIMSGMGSNGTAGAQAIKAVGGLCIAQDPEMAQFPSMPRHLIDSGYADYILPSADMPDVLIAYAAHPYTMGGREADAETTLARERHHVREILAILRTRTRHDFSGYKPATVLRRIQRRMGLSRLTSLSEYARLLRQVTTEVSTLADDLLIHVTGFFRDPESWDILHRKVIAPLVASREHGGSVRAWVTACSSGEEAYSLAMLLIEESERAGKALDIKVFATDLAERALAHARAGVYPGGIESEILPERLERFFSRDDAIYRVRSELRDCVVFAPQNVLQDPPFSRLDIASCRNLLIYLEPETQQRVISLLHFGLREGGALFLGGSETLAGAESLFETIDKKARIFRRVGPTRHGAIEFPLPREFRTGALTLAKPRRRDAIRPSVSQVTQLALLEWHTPAAVTVDRDQSVLYYHGDTRPFLQQPSGEPTRDLLLLAREGVRGAVRTAIRRAAADRGAATVLDGWVEVEPGRRVRVAVTASPALLGSEPDEAATSDLFVVSFQNRTDFPAPEDGSEGEADRSLGETLRLRSVLQSTIEELQTSNEELKASNEEVMSINEELQSANEELETSKEEMQSLNEELSTVNSQLRAKMEEHQAASSDMASLLASTDIAVLFLDTGFRIRRFTPAVRDLFHLIASDVGRPLGNLHREFEDPYLDDDAREVLERLVPVEREVVAGSSRHYLRRVLPYRTMDNRIEGVVVTFVDITARRRAEDALRASEEQFRRAIEGAPIPIIMHAEDGEVLQISRTWTELTGYSMAEVPTLDAWLNRAYGPGADAVRDHVHELFQGTRRTLDVEFNLRTRGGDERRWSFNASEPGILGDGRRFVVGMAVDVSERTRAEDALRGSEGRLRMALSAARMGIWTWDAGNDTHTRDENLNGLLGLDPVETRHPLADFLEHIHPDDRGMVVAAFETSIHGDRPLNTEFRIVRPDGSIRWLRDQGDVTGGDPHRGSQLAGACVDITALKEVEAALRGSEERLRLIVESATDYAILTTDPDRLITGWSPGAEATFGHAAREILGRPADMLFTLEDRAAGAPEEEARTALRDGRAADERWHVRKDGSRFFASGVQTPLGEGGAIGFVKVLRDLTDRKQMEDDLRAAHDMLEARVAERTAELTRANEARVELLRRLVKVQEDERRRVSRELHDGVGQELTALILGLRALEETVPEGSLGHDRLREVEASVARIGREAHDLAVELRPTALDDVGLGPSLSTYVARWSERTEVPAEYQSPGLDGDRLPPEIETAVYRVVQEALNNIARHAGASRVSVIVERRRDELTALVEDDGRGFDSGTVVAGSGRRGLGLLGMRERAALVGGSLLVESEPGGGTTIRVRIPLDTSPREGR